ncbi:hypothetical protein [Aggregatilinea lenta]|uniref:hypothetical protein n=1 Tax=Aggregatilinea lenta TaxID=913108 RepID=UPI000E5A595B|nr:hypothetical protein [Aggregatilinea lenta]
MKRILILVLVSVLALAALLPGASVRGQSADRSRLPLMGLVLDTPENRSMIVYGDLAAWYDSWGITPLADQDELDDLDPDTRAKVLFVMPDQTLPPEVLGLHYLFTEPDQGDYYGFDLFTTDRFVYTSNPPDTLTVLQTNADPDAIAAALTANGYAATAADPGMLYSYQDDYEMDLTFDGPPVGRLGALNRIAVLDDGTLLVARATAIATDALAADASKAESVADLPIYRAAVTALNDEALADAGPLVGAIFVEGLQADDPALMLLGQNATAEQIAALQAQLVEQNDPALLPYLLTTFATFHTPGATSLVLAVTFPPGVDAQAMADALAERMQKYTSLRTRQPMSDLWTLDRAVGVEADGLPPVALVVMRVDDPAPLAEGDQLGGVRVLAWHQMVFARDLGFLVVSAPAE